jgi:dodecin
MPTDCAERSTLVDHTYKITEIVGSSPDSVDDAIRNGIGRAAKTLRGLDWFEVTDIRGALSDGAVGWYQVTMKVGFRLEDGD